MLFIELQKLILNLWSYFKQCIVYVMNVILYAFILHKMPPLFVHLFENFMMWHASRPSELLGQTIKQFLCSQLFDSLHYSFMKLLHISYCSLISNKPQDFMQFNCCIEFTVV